MLNPVKQILNTRFKKTVACSILCWLVAALLWLAQGMTTPVMDHQADMYFEDTLKQAGLAYGTTRLLNASVSVVMESNLQVQPAGVGLSLAVGQVLDPLNDMAERLSDVLVMAIVSLGVQKLVYEISLTVVPLVMAFVFIVLAVLVFFSHVKVLLLQNLLLRFAIVLLALRFFLPLSAMINVQLYEHFFSVPITQSKQAIAVESQSIQSLADFSSIQRPANAYQAEGFWGQLMDTGFLAETSAVLDRKSQQIKQAFLSKQQYAAKLIDHLLALTYLYVALFVIQVIFLPVSLFYCLLRLGQLLKI